MEASVEEAAADNQTFKYDAGVVRVTGFWVQGARYGIRLTFWNETKDQDSTDRTCMLFADTGKYLCECGNVGKQRKALEGWREHLSRSCISPFAIEGRVVAQSLIELDQWLGDEFGRFFREDDGNGIVLPSEFRNPSLQTEDFTTSWLIRRVEKLKCEKLERICDVCYDRLPTTVAGRREGEGALHTNHRAGGHVKLLYRSKVQARRVGVAFVDDWQSVMEKLRMVREKAPAVPADLSAWIADRESEKVLLYFTECLGRQHTEGFLESMLAGLRSGEDKVPIFKATISDSPLRAKEGGFAENARGDRQL